MCPRNPLLKKTLTELFPKRKYFCNIKVPNRLFTYAGFLEQGIITGRVRCSNLLVAGAVLIPLRLYVVNNYNKLHTNLPLIGTDH